MKLVTFQTIEALKSLLNNGQLICDENLVDLEKNGFAYNWIVDKMNKKVPNNTNAKYPLWCWVKCYNGICPPRVKGERIFQYQVKITFHKDDKDVFITDFRRYSFILNNTYIPNSLDEKEKFDNELKSNNITQEELKMFARRDKYKTYRNDKKFLEMCRIINDTFDRCITRNSNILQGCIWNLSLSEVEKIEILPIDEYRYGSLNYIRSNGNRINWQEDFYKRLK